MKNRTIVKYWAFAALLMFVTATLQIVNENFVIGAIALGTATCFLSTAAHYRKKEAAENNQNKEE